MRKEVLHSCPELIDYINRVGFLPLLRMGIPGWSAEEMLDEEIEAMIEKRQAARKERNFALADQIRDELLQKGIILEDTREGVKWKKA